MSAALSLALVGQNPRRVARGIRELLAKLRRPAGAVVFTSGELRDRMRELGEALSQLEPAVPVLLVGGAGVLTERGEVEGQDAAAAIAWEGGRTEAFCIEAEDADILGGRLARTIERAEPSPALLLFIRPERFTPAVLEPLPRAPQLLVSGGGSVGDPGVMTLDPTGRIETGAAAGLFVRGLSRPHVRSSSACKLLTPLTPITEVRGSMVLGIGGQAALDALSSVGRELEGQPLIFVVLEPKPQDRDEAEPSMLLVRAVQGVDPMRGGLVISDEVKLDMRIAFAIRDAGAARSGIESLARDVERASAGAAPRFGVYINCAGRGSSLYGVTDVDTRILRSRFGELPLCGMHSAFEIAPSAGRPSFQLYTGVLTLFTAPS
jgi:small ligand-binding sensory domain FIST